MRWTKKDTQLLLQIMEKTYPSAECALEFQSLFQLLIAVTLSAQTTDKQVNVVTRELFARYPDASSMARATEEEISGIIKRLGLYKTKAKNILQIARILEQEYEGQVPQDRESLVKLPGVGRKTANVVLSVGCGIPAIAVDTHVFRVANRIGVVDESDVLKTEKALMKRLPEETWIMMHHALIWHGRLVCKARNPLCGQCPLRGLCFYEKEHFNRDEKEGPEKEKNQALEQAL